MGEEEEVVVGRQRVTRMIMEAVAKKSLSVLSHQVSPLPVVENLMVWKTGSRY